MSDFAAAGSPQALADDAQRRATAGDLAGAEPLFQRLTEMLPQSADAWAGLGRCRLGLRRAAEAVEPLRRAAELRPSDGGAAINHAGALALVGRHADALAVLDRALGLRPGDAAILFNRGRSLQALGRRDEALLAYEQALERAPHLWQAQSARAALLQETGDRFGALSALDMALAQRPADRALRLRRATLALALGDWLGGLADHELRLDLASDGAWRPDLPLWRGEPIDQRQLLLFSEARDEASALAEILQLARFLPLLAPRAAAVALEVPDAALPWFAQAKLPDNVRAVARGTALEPDLLAVAVLSLLQLCEAEPANLPPPWPVPSVARRAAGPVRRIGFAPACDIAARRIPVAAIEPLTAGDRTIVALQDFADAPPWLTATRSAAAPDLQAMADTLADLDLVVAADNWIAHLAGSMGLPVAILLDTAADWRWLDSRSDTPWYPSATLYRQITPGDWKSVIARLAQALAN